MSSACRPNSIAPQTVLARIMRCDCRTPLGVPVVPLVSARLRMSSSSAGDSISAVLDASATS